MTSQTALALGRMKDGIDDECRVASRRQLADCDVGEPVITRTLDNFGLAKAAGLGAGRPRQQGHASSRCRSRLAELGGFEGALRHLIHGFDDAAHVARASTSSGIFARRDRRAVPRLGRTHDYILLADQSDTPRMLEALHKRAWLAGLGWLMVGAAGQLLERSIVDVSVGSPERLVFEGAPVVVAPLVQDTSKRSAQLRRAATAPLDSRKAVPT